MAQHDGGAPAGVGRGAVGDAVEVDGHVEGEGVEVGVRAQRGDVGPRHGLDPDAAGEPAAARVPDAVGFGQPVLLAARGREVHRVARDAQVEAHRPVAAHRRELHHGGREGALEHGHAGAVEPHLERSLDTGHVQQQAPVAPGRGRIDLAPVPEHRVGRGIGDARGRGLRRERHDDAVGVRRRRTAKGAVAAMERPRAVEAAPCTAAQGRPRVPHRVEGVADRGRRVALDGVGQGGRGVDHGTALLTGARGPRTRPFRFRYSFDSRGRPGPCQRSVAVPRLMASCTRHRRLAGSVAVQRSVL